MPISATACRTSSNLNGLMTAVISFMHLSLLSPVNDNASGTASAYYSSLSVAASVPAQTRLKSMGWAPYRRRDAPTWREPRLGRVTGVQGAGKFRRSHELYQFEPTRRTGAAPGGVSARVRARLRPRFRGQFQGRAAVPTEQARLGQPAGIRRTGRHSGANPSQADRHGSAPQRDRSPPHAPVGPSKRRRPRSGDHMDVSTRKHLSSRNDAGPSKSGRTRKRVKTRKDVSTVFSRAPLGLHAPLVRVEVHLGTGLPTFAMVGLPETVVRESKERVRSALLNSGFEFPTRRITVNLSPADLPKEGGRFDLPIAVGILAACGKIPPRELEHREFYGELSLGGELRETPKLLPALIEGSRSTSEMILPFANALEASLVRHAKLKLANHLRQVCDALNGRAVLSAVPSPADLTSVAHLGNSSDPTIPAYRAG